MRRNQLYLVAAVVWGAPGVMLMVKGIRAYAVQSPADVWWLLLVTAAVMLMFFVIFRRVVAKYSAHIASQAEPTTICKTFPLRGWLLIIFMMGLGMLMRLLPSVPTQFTASFYSALGSMLVFSAIKFLCNMKNEADV